MVSITSSKPYGLTAASYFGTGLLFIFLLDQRFDGDFAIYRFAQHLLAGHGLVYNTSGPIISTYPTAPMLLAISTLSGLQIPLAADIMLITALTVGALCVHHVGNSSLSGFVYVLIGTAIPSLVIAIMLAFALTALVAVHSQRWQLAGILAGLAILTSPFALPLVAIMLILAFHHPGAVRRFLPPAVLIPCLAFLVIRLSLGSDVQFVSSIPAALILALALGAIAMFIVSRAKQREIATLAGGLSVAAFITLIGGQLIQFPIGKPASGEIDVGKWLATNSEKTETVAANQIAALAFYADRSIIDSSNNTLGKDFFARYAPDLVVLGNDQNAAWDAFSTTYAKVYAVEGFTVYHRVVNFAALNDHVIDELISGQLNRDDLRLAKASFADQVHPSDLLRVQLDWQLTYAPSFDIKIKFVLVDDQNKTLAEAVDTVPIAVWGAKTVTTYHLFGIPGNVTAEHLNLRLNVTMRGGDLGTQTIGVITVTK